MRPNTTKAADNELQKSEVGEPVPSTEAHTALGRALSPPSSAWGGSTPQPSATVPRSSSLPAHRA